MEKLDDRDLCDKSIFVTNNCNSNCMMCPDGEASRKRRSAITLDKLLARAGSIHENTPFICITGGEPTLLGYDFIQLAAFCRSRFNHTDFLLLTNGRTFADPHFTAAFAKNAPRGIVAGIPIYADGAELHDKITQAPCSFQQAVNGIERLMSAGIAVEIRVVVMRQNYQFLEKIAEFILNRFPNILRVHFMSLEMMGNARQNKDSVWVDFQDASPFLKRAVLFLIGNGVSCGLYNYPLCHTDKSLWSLCAKSITPSKVRFAGECDACSARGQCCGFFASTLAFMKLRGIAVQEAIYA